MNTWQIDVRNFFRMIELRWLKQARLGGGGVEVQNSTQIHISIFVIVLLLWNANWMILLLVFPWFPLSEEFPGGVLCH